ncbi:MAG TPA: DUF262 domain-containing protein [Thermoanaerobaculia bacterium]|nr:DUF262 domain-containing protein [Thermoanaerobaculia bacterium]
MTANVRPAAGWEPMNYRNTEMKLDQLVNYLNDEKINLNPVFQRGQVWQLSTRRKLIANIVQGRPIPAIFLYKDAEGARYSYNILDGKQRLESLILFVGNARPGFAIPQWHQYFFPPAQRKHAHFWIQLPTGKATFAKLADNVVRDFREYSIPTIEITLSEGSSLDEIIGLFVDINQQGVAVSRFDVAKAMGDNNRLLKSVFKLVAIKETRGAQAPYYKLVNNDFTRVLKRLETIGRAGLDPRSQVDRMWERLLEIALFARSRQHRKPVDILKSFISAGRSGRVTKSDPTFAPVSPQEIRTLRRVFRTLRVAYTATALQETTLATDQAHFYTMVTSFLDSDLMMSYSESELHRRLLRFAQILGGETGKPSDKKLARLISRFQNLAQDRTTDSERRIERQQKFVQAIKILKP